MIPRFLLAAGLLFTLLSGTTRAQTTHQTGPTIALKAGMMLGLSPESLRQNYNSSYSAGGWASFPVDSHVVIRPSAEYGQLDFDVRQFLEDSENAQNIVGVTGGSYRALALGIDALFGFNRSSMVAAYAIVGAAYYRGTIDDYRVRAIEGVTSVEGSSNSGIGLTAGAGIRADMNEQLGAFAETKLLLGIMDENDLIMHLSVGIFFKI